MSLDTVIKIGQFYRETRDAWKYHDQINWAMNDVKALEKKKDKDGNTITTTFYEVNIIDNGDSFFFDFDSMSRIIDEDKIKSIYYLNFKTSDKDSSKYYLLGDLIYSYYENKKGNFEEGGNYRMHGVWADKEKNGIVKKNSSFWMCEKVANDIDNLFIRKFRSEFRRNAEYIEQFLKTHTSVVLHFNFNEKSWQDMDGIVNSIDSILVEKMVEPQPNNRDKVMLISYLHRTLKCCKSGGVTPGFGNTEYKNYSFTRDEVISLMYAKNVTQKPLIRIGGLGIIALPHSEELTSDMVVCFFERDKSTLEQEEGKEIDITTVDEDDSCDPAFKDLLENDFDDLVKFDIVFTKLPTSPADVFSDLIEFSDVQKSLLRKVHKRIMECRQAVEKMAYEESNIIKPYACQICSSFQIILEGVAKDKKKFRSHILKVLPQIYTDTYYEDPILLPAFLEKVEYNIRNGNRNFNRLKYDFYFLMKIQKKNMLMEITDSKSYALGKQLGIMARRFALWRGDNCPIKSFEKSYVGNLSRRTASLDDLIKFVAFLNEKLIIHGETTKMVKDAYLKFVDILKDFGKEKYNKSNCSLGFFEGYYDYRKSEEEKEEITDAN